MFFPAQYCNYMFFLEIVSWSPLWREAFEAAQVSSFYVSGYIVLKEEFLWIYREEEEKKKHDNIFPKLKMVEILAQLSDLVNLF